jgi:hypothetical protein
VETDHFYASDDKSSVELICDDFAASRARSSTRHEADRRRRADRILTADAIIPAVCMASIVVIVLGLLSHFLHFL